jgi:hypothetical protein
VYRKLGLAGALLALLALLASCGTAAPVAEGQVGSASDPRPNQASGLDQDLLKQVDAAIAAAKAKGADVSVAQALRDSAVDLDRQGHHEEANGNLKTAAQQVGVLRPAGNAAASSASPDNLPAIPAIPAVQPAVADVAGATALNPKFDSPDALKSWQRVGKDTPIGAPLWDVVSGMLMQRGVDGVQSDDSQTGLVTGDPAWKDVTIRTSVLVQGTKEVGLIVRQSDAGFYRFRALALGTGTNSGNLILEKVVGDQATQIATFDGPEISADVWHSLGLSARGNTITAFVDGKSVGSAQDSSFTSGRAGVSSVAISGAYFANVQVIGR